MRNTLIVNVYFSFSQNTTLSWNTTNPELTDCFQKTVLVWVPCAYLWLAAFLDAYYILNSKEKNIPWNPLNITKLIVTCLLMVLKFVDLGVTVHKASADESDVFNADYFSPILKIATFVSTWFLSLYFCLFPKGFLCRTTHSVYIQQLHYERLNHFKI